MFKKFLFVTLFTLGLVLLFSSKAYAAVDITLEDNPDDGTLEIIIDSKESLLPGIDMDINFSGNLVIKEIINSSNYCSLGFNTLASNGVISIECLNDSSIIMNDTLATIEYNSDGDEYYFYVNQNTLDIGDNEVGTVQNINKPENIESDSNDITDKTTNSTSPDFVDNMIEFLRNNYLYISGIVIVISIILITLLFRKPSNGK